MARTRAEQASGKALRSRAEGRQVTLYGPVLECFEEWFAESYLDLVGVDKEGLLQAIVNSAAFSTLGVLSEPGDYPQELNQILKHAAAFERGEVPARWVEAKARRRAKQGTAAEA